MGGGAGVWAFWFLFLLPPFNVWILPPLHCSAPHPWARPLGFPVREGVTKGKEVGEAQEADGLLPSKSKGRAGQVDTQAWRPTLYMEWPRGGRWELGHEGPES